MKGVRVSPQLRALSDLEVLRAIDDGHAYVDDSGAVVPFASGGASVTAGFETGTNGNNIATSDTGDATAFGVVSKSGSGAATYSNTHAAFGTLSGRLATTSSTGYSRLAWTAGLGDVDSYWRLYLWLTANPTTTTCEFIRLWDDNSGGQAVGIIIIQANGIIQVQNGVGGSTVGTVAITTGQWVRLEGRVLCGASGTIECKLFNTASSTTASDTITITGQTRSNLDWFYFGVNADGSSKTNNVEMWLDQIVAGTPSYPGPFVPQVGSTPLPRALTDMRLRR